MRGRQSKENLSISKVNTSSQASSYKPQLYNRVQRIIGMKPKSQISQFVPSLKPKLPRPDESSNDSGSDTSNHNIWDTDLDSNDFFHLFENRFKSYPNLAAKITKNEVVSKIKRLVGCKIEMKNLSQYPWFTYGEVDQKAKIRSTTQPFR